MTDSEKLDSASIQLKSFLLLIAPNVIDDKQTTVNTEDMFESLVTVLDLLDSVRTSFNNNNTSSENTNIPTETITSEQSVPDTPVKISNALHLNPFDDDDDDDNNDVTEDDRDKAAKEITNKENEVFKHLTDTDIPIPNTHKRKTFKGLKKMLIRPFLACLGLKKANRTEGA